MEFQIGSPIKVDGLLGHVIEREGGIVEFSTPHGTKIKAGFVWFARNSSQLSDEDQTRLKALILDAKNRR